MAQKFDGSKHRSTLGRPRLDRSVKEWVVQLARENRPWGDKRIAGALEILGHNISRQTVANILKCHSLAPVPERGKRMRWKDFIQSHSERNANPNRRINQEINCQQKPPCQPAQRARPFLPGSDRPNCFRRFPKNSHRSWFRLRFIGLEAQTRPGSESEVFGLHELYVLRHYANLKLNEPPVTCPTILGRNAPIFGRFSCSFAVKISGIHKRSQHLASRRTPGPTMGISGFP